MPNSRREFLQSTAVMAAGLLGANPQLFAAETSAAASAATTAAQATSDSPVQIPTMKFGGVEISRLVLGVNPLYGFAHYNNNYSKVMADWYTPDRVCEVLHRANHYGINAFNYVNFGRAPQDLARFQAEGCKMHLIAQVAAGHDAAHSYGI